MILTRTPLRITLGGGGTDLPSYYARHGGFVFAMGVDKYVHVMVNRPVLETGVRFRYDRSETVESVSDLKHDLARVALLSHGIANGVDVWSMADLPDGTGLGSSGAFLVGVLKALHETRRTPVGPDDLAEEACRLELDVLGKRVGKQDQYMAAYGGLTVLDIAQNGAVSARRVRVGGEAVRALTSNTHLYYTGVRRNASEVLAAQDGALSSVDVGATERAVTDSLHRIKDLGQRILQAIEAEDLDGWGLLLHEHWEQKKRLSDRITLSAVDALYDHVRRDYGVLGGKIAGAGGGGFLLLYCQGDGARLEAFMKEQGMPRVAFDLAPVGVQVIAGSSPDAAPARPSGAGVSATAAQD